MGDIDPAFALAVTKRVMCEHSNKEHLPREDRTNPYGPWRCLDCGYNSGQRSDWWEPPLEETPIPSENVETSTDAADTEVMSIQSWDAAENVETPA